MGAALLQGSGQLLARTAWSKSGIGEISEIGKQGVTQSSPCPWLCQCSETPGQRVDNCSEHRGILCWAGISTAAPEKKPNCSNGVRGSLITPTGPCTCVLHPFLWPAMGRSKLTRWSNWYLKGILWAFKNFALLNGKRIVEGLAQEKK